MSTIDTNNAAAINLRQADNSLANLNGKPETDIVTFTAVNGKLRIADLH